MLTRSRRSGRRIVRKTRGDERLRGIFAEPLSLAFRVRHQRQNQRGPNRLPSGSVPRVYSLHAPEVECIGKGKAHRPYEFGVKVSVATTLAHSKGGQFIAHVKALPGNPYDGHTLETVIPEIETQIIHAPDMPTLGMGECTFGPTAAAIGNAVAHALGARIRDMPLTRERLAAALLG